MDAFAQKQKMDEDEKTEKRDARTGRIKDKTDYALFHRQMLSMKEYADERRKIPNLQKANKVPVRVVATVDTTNDAPDEKTLVGYITQIIGDNTSNVYEVTFDRVQKKIVSAKFTGDPGDMEPAEKAEKSEKAAPRGAAPSKTVHKKNKDDDDDDADDEKPGKKEKDDDN